MSADRPIVKDGAREGGKEGSQIFGQRVAVNSGHGERWGRGEVDSDTGLPPLNHLSSVEPRARCLLALGIRVPSVRWATYNHMFAWKFNRLKQIRFWFCIQHMNNVY